MVRYVVRKQKKPCFHRAFRAIKVPPRGVEFSQESSGKTPDPDQSGTVCGTPYADNTPIDSDLQILIDYWPTLPETIRKKIVAMVRTTDK